MKKVFLMKNNKIALPMLLSALMLSSCGETPSADIQETEPPVTAAVTESVSETVSETQTSISETVAETTVTEKEYPDTVKTLIEKKKYWQDIVNEAMQESYGELQFWFQDIDMDGTPEFIVGGSSFGAHGARGYSVFKVDGGDVKLMKDIHDDYSENVLMFWLHDEEENSQHPELAGFAAKLFCDEQGNYEYLTYSVDSTADKMEYYLERLVPADGGFKQEKILTFYMCFEPDGSVSYMFEPEWDSEKSKYTGTISKEEFLSRYDIYFSFLSPCEITIAAFPYASTDWDEERMIKEYYDDDEKLAEDLAKSLEAWDYCENFDVKRPFAEAVDEIRAYEEKKEPDLMPEYTDANGNITAKPKLMYADDFDGYIRETFGEDGDFCAYTFDGKYYI